MARGKPKEQPDIANHWDEGLVNAVQAFYAALDEATTIEHDGVEYDTSNLIAAIVIGTDVTEEPAWVPELDSTGKQVRDKGKPQWIEDSSDKILSLTPLPGCNAVLGEMSPGVYTKFKSKLTVKRSGYTQPEPKAAATPAKSVAAQMRRR